MSSHRKEEGGEEEEEEEEEDFVVKEIDVFLSHTLASNLHIFQYPLRPPWRPYDKDNLSEVRYKQNIGKIELDFSLEQSSENYDQNNPTPYKRPQYTLSSSSVLPKSNYVVGILREGALHMTPLKGVYQLRPSFRHIDNMDKQKKDKEEAEEKSNVKPKKQTRKALQVEYKRPETARAKYYREKSHAFLQQTEEQEPWKKLIYSDRSKNSVATRTCFEALLSPSYTPVIFDAYQKTYVDTIIPQSSDEGERIKQKSLGNVLSMDGLKKLNLEERIRALLGTVHILSFSNLCYMANVSNEDDVLPILEKVGVLVAGRWVSSSEFWSDMEERAAREYILLLFHKGEHVQRRTLTEKTRLSTNAVKRLLKTIAILSTDRKPPEKPYWTLKLPVDETFITTYPEVVNRQNDLWKEKEESIMKKIQKKETATKGPSKESILRDFFKDLFLTNGVCSIEFIKEQITHKKIDSSSPAMLARVLKSMCTERHNTYFLKSCGDETKDKYRNILLQLFKGSVVVKKEEAKRKIKEKLGEEITDDFFFNLIEEFATPKRGSKNGTWIFKTGD